MSGNYTAKEDASGRNILSLNITINSQVGRTNHEPTHYQLFEKYLFYNCKASQLNWRTKQVIQSIFILRTLGIVSQLYFKDTSIVGE